MKMIIKAEAPVCISSNNEVTIKLNVHGGDNGTISIDFSTLIQFANLVSIETVDFFILSACVYGIDRFIERRSNSVDGWSRELKVSLPVVNVKKWKAVQSEIESLLSFVTGDYWEVDFHASNFKCPKRQLDSQFNVKFSQDNLFSGGLDSLIGAIDFLHANPKSKLLLASHYDSLMHGPLRDQKDLLEKLEEAYKGQFTHMPSVKVALEETTLPRETTCRSRSILFLGIALMAAETMKISIAVPENGTVSLNYPLSPSRRSACSTRTTHPTMISLVKEILTAIGIHSLIFNPFEFSTKGERVTKCLDQKLLQRIVHISNSCGKRGHRSHWEEGKRNASHCGVCMPCVYRQASLLSMSDDTTYGNDINSLRFTSKKGQDIGACLECLRVPVTRIEVKNELIINGVKDLNNLDRYVDVVMRTRKELKKWIKKIGNSSVKEKAGIL